MNPHPPPYTLQPLDIADLRASLRVRTSDGTFGQNLACPFITWDAPDARFILHAYGRSMCASPRVEVLASILRNERAEPGYITRILNPAVDPETACKGLDPYLAFVLRREAVEARQKAEAEAADEAHRAARRAASFDLNKMELDDL